MGLTLTGPSFACKLEVTDDDKHSSLLRYSINYNAKTFYSTGAGDNLIKHLTVLIYENS
jgi:hypothetical protein